LKFDEEGKYSQIQAHMQRQASLTKQDSIPEHVAMHPDDIIAA
jgi:hypothetical protein